MNASRRRSHYGIPLPRHILIIIDLSCYPPEARISSCYAMLTETSKRALTEYNKIRKSRQVQYGHDLIPVPVPGFQPLPEHCTICKNKGNGLIAVHVIPCDDLTLIIIAQTFTGHVLPFYAWQLWLIGIRMLINPMNYIF
jgi:hypothetical protein